MGMRARQPANGILGIDHPVVAARDLQAARKAYERLGFTVPPRGSHVEWGTGNLCIMFPDDYLEIRGIVDASRFTMHLDSHLERFGEGLMGVAFATHDVEASFAACLAAGVDCGELRQLTRNFEHPEGWTQPAFRLFAPAARDIEGLMHVVVIEHLTPDLIRRDDFLQHQNGCLGVAGVAGTIDDVSRSADSLARLLGEERVRRDADGVQLSMPGGQLIDLLLPAVFTRRYGRPAPAEPRLCEMLLRVADMGTLRSVLEQARVPYTTGDGAALQVDAAYCCGAGLTFIDGAVPRR